MNKGRVQALTLAVMSCVIGAVMFRGSGTDGAAAGQPGRAQTAQDAIHAMLDAAQAGDTTKYLEAFSGELAVSLRQTWKEQGDAAFARDLRANHVPLKGIAIDEPETLNGGAVRARVEYVYSDRNEAQWIYLETQDGRWRIARMENVERVPARVPFGTPVK